jgi:lipase
MALLNLHHNGPINGTPLLAIHGITAHGQRFDRMCAEYLVDRRVVSPDLRGHGESICDAPWNLETHVADLVETMDSIGFDCVDVMGHSLGGNLALRLLAAHPDRVKRVVLLDPAFDLPAETMTANAVAALVDQSFATQRELIIAKRAFRSDAAIPTADADSEMASFQGADGRWRIRYDRAAVVAMWGELARPLPPIPIAKPTLLINALQAKMVVEPQISYLETQLGHNLTQVELDLGHMLYWDDFAATSRVVAGYLADSSKR